MDVYLAAATAPVSYNQEDRPIRAIRHAIQYLLYKTGPMTACVAEAGAFIRSSEDVRSPDIQIHCLPAYVIDHGRLMVHGPMSDLLQTHHARTLEDLFFDLTSKESLS